MIIRKWSIYLAEIRESKLNSNDKTLSWLFLIHQTRHIALSSTQSQIDNLIIYHHHIHTFKRAFNWLLCTFLYENGEHFITITTVMNFYYQPHPRVKHERTLFLRRHTNS